MRQYTALITENNDTVSYEIDGWANSPQEFHKIVMFEHIKYPKEEILKIYNQDKKVVFSLNKGFSGL